jgi:hypothetical protein
MILPGRSNPQMPVVAIGCMRIEERGYRFPTRDMLEFYTIIQYNRSVYE